MILHGAECADVPLRNCSPTHLLQPMQNLNQMLCQFADITDLMIAAALFSSVPNLDC